VAFHPDKGPDAAFLGLPDDNAALSERIGREIRYHRVFT
jgi:hypothetical protein